MKTVLVHPGGPSVPSRDPDRRSPVTLGVALSTAYATWRAILWGSTSRCRPVRSGSAGRCESSNETQSFGQSRRGSKFPRFLSGRGAAPGSLGASETTFLFHVIRDPRWGLRWYSGTSGDPEPGRGGETTGSQGGRRTTRLTGRCPADAGRRRPVGVGGARGRVRGAVPSSCGLPRSLPQASSQETGSPDPPERGVGEGSGWTGACRTRRARSHHQCIWRKCKKSTLIFCFV